MISTVVVLFFLLFLLWIIGTGIYKGLVKKEIPGYYGTPILKGDDAVRHGWVLVGAGLFGLAMLLVVVMVASGS